uniref:FAD/NAD(P)-binding domain-containing protein n=1 Tax=Pelusios castaneus TaxID=367368 RepID=A0A8C8RGF4_9SAUR
LCTEIQLSFALQVSVEDGKVFITAKKKVLTLPSSHSKGLQCPGSNLENVCNLQTPEDAKRILQLATGRRVVVLGASFIGMEVAAFLSDRASAICIVEREEFPFQAVLGPHVGEVAMKMLQNKGVKFYMKAEISELRGENRKVSKSLTPMPLLDCSQNLGLSFLFQSGHMPFPSTGHLVSKAEIHIHAWVRYSITMEILVSWAQK